MSNSPECPCLTIPQGHEEHLIPYSVVQPVYVQTKRPVIFSPSILSHGLIERLLQPAESGLIFDTCSPGTCTAIALYEPLGRPKHDGEKEFFFSSWKLTRLQSASRGLQSILRLRRDERRPCSCWTPAAQSTLEAYACSRYRRLLAR